jgi:hypothetical protein
MPRSLHFLLYCPINFPSIDAAVGKLQYAAGGVDANERTDCAGSAAATKGELDEVIVGIDAFA